jgi:diguanylate cyclase (GGDEF)-like protein/PAS domain S-box-containing protein
VREQDDGVNADIERGPGALERGTGDTVHEAQEFFRCSFEQAPIGMTIVDLDGRCMPVNDAFCALVGYSREQLTDQRRDRITYPDDVAADADARRVLVAGDATSDRRERRYVHASERLIWVAVTLTLVRDGNGLALYFVSQVQDVSERRGYERQLAHIADHDVLTGLRNRLSLERELASHAARVRRYGATGAVLMLDLDHFKYFNDTQGHKAGDELIVRVGQALCSRLRDSDVVARLGGDEFAVLLPDGDEAETQRVGEALVEIVRNQALPALADPLPELLGAGPRVTFSIGIARLPPLTGANHPLHMPMTRPHEWTTTNLHTHGLHVSPSGKADNVFRTIPPGERAQFKISVPDDHPAGLFWYHPHHHGAVTQQVRAGMAGAIIVRGDLDQVDEVRAAKEQIMVLQSIELGADYQLLDPIPDPTKEQAFFPRKNVLYTVNGVLNPKITMYPGEVQRWRMVNAAEGKFLSLKLADHELNVLAWDGLTLAAPDAVELVMMSAGNRVEVLVKAGKPGIYDLVLTPGSSQKPNIPGMPPSAPARASRSELLLYCSLLGMQSMPGLQDQPGELVPRTIATIEVRDHGPEMRLPGSLPAWDPPMLPIARTRTVGYTVQRQGMDEFVSFGINGKPFDPDRAPYKVKLGTAQEWTIVNECDNKLMDHAHVFHIHVNPFKITKRNGQTLSTPLWRDTYVVTKHAGDSFTFESNFVDFTGTFVEHCHVIAHEDLGMMEAIEVVE